MRLVDYCSHDFFFSDILTDFNYFLPFFFSLQMVQDTGKTSFKWGGDDFSYFSLVTKIIFEEYITFIFFVTIGF